MSRGEKGILAVVTIMIVAIIGFALVSRGGSDGGSATCEDGVVETASGLKYEDLECGNATVAKNGDLVLVHYTLKLEDGETFDSSRDRDPIQVRIGAGQVLPGFEEGLIGMGVGGQRRVTVPPELGYGAQGSGEIPPNETLTFELELLEVAES